MPASSCFPSSLRRFDPSSLLFPFALPRRESYILCVRCPRQRRPDGRPPNACLARLPRRSPSHFLAMPAAPTPRPAFFLRAHFSLRPNCPLKPGRPAVGAIRTLRSVLPAPRHNRCVGDTVPRLTERLRGRRWRCRRGTIARRTGPSVVGRPDHLCLTRFAPASPASSPRCSAGRRPHRSPARRRSSGARKSCAGAAPGSELLARIGRQRSRL